MCVFFKDGVAQQDTKGPYAKYTRLPALLIKTTFFSPEESLSNCHCRFAAELRHVFLMGIIQRTKPLLLSSCSRLIPWEIKRWTQMAAMLHPDQLTLPQCFCADRQHCQHRIKSYWGEKRGSPKHLKTMLRSRGHLLHLNTWAARTLLRWKQWKC